MFIFKLVKSFILKLYKGLIYWFFWASFVSMRDELFCPYAPETTESRNIMENVTTPPVRLATAKAYDLLVTDRQICFIHPTEAIVASFMAHMLSNLRALMNAVKDLPEKHRARLRFSSD